NGSEPRGGIIEDSNGDLFGTTEYGGTGYTGPYIGPFTGYGTVWMVKEGSNAITVLGNLQGPNGAHPIAGLTEDSSGNLYGKTPVGGATGAGTVFQVPTRLCITTDALTD